MTKPQKIEGGKKREINITRSETWLTDDFKSMSELLEETINEFVDADERIINIECKTDETGLSRFWIYSEKLNNL